MATVKQKLAFKEVLKGSSISGAMRKAGYSPTTASTTGKLTQTDGWHELMDKFISDEALMKVHKEGLKAHTYFNEIVDRDAKGAPVYALKEVPDFGVRHKYLESGYKIKGKHMEKPAGSTLIVVVAGESAARYGIHTPPDTSNSSE